MRIPKCFTLLAVAMLPLSAGFSQTVNPSTAPQASAPATLPSSADEVVRLAQSGVGDQVVLAFIGQSLWDPGWWSWNGGAWFWIGGGWHHPVRPGHVWFNGNFNHGRGAEPFHGGHRH